MYVQQKVFRLADEFNVYGENKEPLYSVYGKFFSFGKQLSIRDNTEMEVAFLKQEVFSFLAKFYFYIDGAVVAEMERKLSLFRPNYYIKGLDWECKGDFWAHNYQIVHDGEIIATIKKEWLSWGDFYTIDVIDEINSLEVLMVCLAIDVSLQMDSVAANTASASNN